MNPRAANVKALDRATCAVTPTPHLCGLLPAQTETKPNNFHQRATNGYPQPILVVPTSDFDGEHPMFSEVRQGLGREGGREGG